MHFDDRLATVLQHRAAGERAARVQFRQLLDLLGEPEGGGDRGLTRAAYRRLDALGLLIPLAQRERLAGECSARIRNPRLLAWFGAAEPRIALAALSRAGLDDGQWLELIPELPIRARGLLRHRRNLPRVALDLLDRLGVQDRILPEPVSLAEPTGALLSPTLADETVTLELDDVAAEDLAVDPAPETHSDQVPDQPAAWTPDVANLGALVKRIEDFQRARQQRAPVASAEPAPPQPAETNEAPIGEAEAEAFLFTTDDTGRIDWAEGARAPLIVGTQLAQTGALSEASAFTRAFARRLPAMGARHDLAGAPAIAGRWVLDAAPRFAPRSGRFTGYVGRFRRPIAAAPDTGALRAADRVRQLLHELRTPVTAIQGFAEVIQQQTVGPVPHEYRALAAGIAGDAARMLAGFAEIERLAQLEAGLHEPVEGSTDFVMISRRQVAQLQTVLSPRVSRIEAQFLLQSALVPMASEGAETIAWRFLGTLAAALEAGETLALSLDGEDASLRLVAQLPAALAHAADVFAGDIHPAGGALGLGLLGAGFALRLARAEARAAGGDLVRDGLGALILTLPMGESRRVAQDQTQHHTRSVPGGRAAAPLAQTPRPR